MAYLELADNIANIDDVPKDTDSVEVEDPHVGVELSRKISI